jgi:hypothetical protein
VLVPCYKEALELVRHTLRCALDADLPDYTRRTIYLCDDGAPAVTLVTNRDPGCKLPLNCHSATIATPSDSGQQGTLTVAPLQQPTA